jgi:hypothetical protein
MKRKCCYFFVLALWLNMPAAMAHGRSEQMSEELNAKAPEWLLIGDRIKAEPVIPFSDDQIFFRSRSGGATNSRNRIEIPSRGIEIVSGYNIDWTGNNEAGIGVSLSPDGKKLIVNAGPTSHLYEIEANATYHEVPLQLPHVTYDEGPKGYLREWSWADDQTLVARAEITDEAGHEIVENRIYVYYMTDRVLSRLDLSALNLPTTDGLEITKVGSDLNHLKFIVGNDEFTAKADLSSPPRVEKPEARMPKRTDLTTAVPNQPAFKAPEVKAVTTNKEPALMSWPIRIGILIVAFSLLLFYLTKTKASGL